MSAALERGATVAGYRVDGVLGAGGMGVVYRATQLSLNRLVALKVLPSELSEDKSFRERFRREGQLQAAIDHPHIVTVYEAGDSEYGLFIAMRVVQGPTLKDLIGGGRLDPARAVGLLGQVGDALDAAHEKELIHRDVKPQNILVDANDHAYLADFGLTRAPDAEGPTETGQFVGTLDYISPEQARGEGATGKSDVYALTGVLYESLTGEVPYPRASEPAVMFAHLSEPPPKVTERRPDLPAALDDVIAHGMAKNAAERPASARALIDEAAAALNLTAPAPAGVTRPYGAAAPPQVTAPAQVTVPSHEAGGETRFSAVPAEVAAPAPPRRRTGLLIGAGVAVAAVVAAGFVLGSSGGDSEDSGDGGPALTQSASAGNVEVSFPAGWRRLSGAPAVPGVTFSNPMVLAEGNAKGGDLSAGEVDAAGPTLLPAGLRARLESPLPRGEPVALGDVQAVRYRNVQPRGAAAPLTLYAVPTADGVVTLACAPGAPAAAADFLRTCERVAGTLRLIGTRAYPLGPSPEHARALTRELGRLNTARSGPERDLAAARTPAAQASAAAALAAAYSDASARLERLKVTPYAQEAHTGLVVALRRTADAYAAAARAARGSDRAAYLRARGTLRRATATQRRALAMLREIGYAISG